MYGPAIPAGQKWREILGRQRASGLGVGAFCRRNAIPASSFFAWRRRLSEAAAAPAFVEAKVAARGSSTLSSDEAISPKSRGPRGSWPAGVVEVRLRGGRRVRVGRGLDRELLIDVVSVLEGLP